MTSNSRLSRHEIYVSNLNDYLAHATACPLSRSGLCRMPVLTMFQRRAVDRRGYSARICWAIA